MKKKSVKNINPSMNNSKAQRKAGKNYLEEEAQYWSKDYTNEHIRAQIKENSQMFSLIIGILTFGLFIILLSFFIAYIKIAPDVSVYLWLSEELQNQVWGLVIGIPLMILASY